MYKRIWLAFVDMEASEGKRFNDLIEIDKGILEEYLGAWGNILVVNDRINEVPLIIKAGLKEIGMNVRFIDKIENVESLAEYGKLNQNVLEEVDWLLDSGYVFKISDKLFPYTELIIED